MIRSQRQAPNLVVGEKRIEILKPFEHLGVADKHCQRTEKVVEGADAILQQDEGQDVASLVKVHLGHHHIDGVGEGKDGGEEDQADCVVSYRSPSLAARGGETATSETKLLLHFGGYVPGAGLLISEWKIDNLSTNT